MACGSSQQSDTCRRDSLKVEASDRRLRRKGFAMRHETSFLFLASKFHLLAVEAVLVAHGSKFYG